MKYRTLCQFSLLALILEVFLAGPTTAGEWSWWPLHGQKCRLDCVGKYCCDDYVRKPLPRVCCVRCTCCDDYCAKPLPCFVPVKCFGCDDYCGKPLPRLVCPPSPHLQCPRRCRAAPRGVQPGHAEVIPRSSAGWASR